MKFWHFHVKAVLYVSKSSLYERLLKVIIITFVLAEDKISKTFWK